jgi:predicted signal transduction protein with EAL and GGDEF domain
MMRIPRVLQLLAVDTRDIVLVRAQLDTFNKQVPLLYFMICVNAVLCAIGVAGTVPRLVGVYIPTALILLCVVRMVVWTRARTRVLTDQQARRRLAGLVKLGAAIGILYIGWSLVLYDASHEPVQKAHVVYAVLAATTSSAICLMHLRAATRVLALVVSVPFCVFLIMTGNWHFTVMGITQLLLTGAVVYVLAVASHDFDRMIQLSAENARLTNIDSLTGLPNRRQPVARRDPHLVQPVGARHRVARVDRGDPVHRPGQRRGSEADRVRDH